MGSPGGSPRASVAAPPGDFDASRFGALHDAQYDYYGRRLATASADCVVRIWDTHRHQVMNELRGHTSPVRALSWAQGSFASNLASCTGDGHVIVWREVKPGEWQIVRQMRLAIGATALAFSPHDYGLVLAVAGKSGDVTMITRRVVTASPMLPAGEQWPQKEFQAHPGGVIGLCWAPSTSPAMLVTGPAAARAAPFGPRRLVTCGSDGVARTWRYDEKGDSWFAGQELADQKQMGNVRDVAWRPNCGLPTSIIALCTDQGMVATWVQEVDGQAWQLQSVWRVEGDARRLFWSRLGTLLGVAVGDSGSLLFKEGMPGDWSQVTSWAD